MTPEEMADLHRACFDRDRPWSEQEFNDLIASPHVSVHHRPGGFAMVRAVAGEHELLTLAVDPNRRRKGIASRLMADWLDTAQGETAFLEVSADNTGARRLYERHGFAETGRRKGYYSRAHSTPVDAVLMSVALTHR